MGTELIISLASFIGAIVSLIAAVSAIRRDEIRARIERKKLEQEDEDRKREITTQVADDTVGLYQRLASQYEEMNEKDKQLLRTISFVIRKMLVLDRTVSDMLSEIETRMDTHYIEADQISCPYYDDMSNYMTVRLSGIESIIRETMQEIDKLLLNGNGQKDQE